MTTVYIIFAAVGWTWFAVVAGYIWWRLRTARRTPRRRGFEVVRPDAQ